MSFRRTHKQYTQSALNEGDLDLNPFAQFNVWFRNAEKEQIGDWDAIALATASRDGFPSVRMVYLREFDERGFVFYTNYQSRKGHELRENPQASILLFWRELERQIRVEGIVRKVSRRESDEYFDQRAKKSRYGAWASQQSQPIADRQVLTNAFRRAKKHFENKPIPRPKFWGGYRIVPLAFEFWQGGKFRLHDRFRYSRPSIQSRLWTIQRLSP